MVIHNGQIEIQLFLQLDLYSPEFDHRWGENDDNIEEVQEATHRLAVCNMDWDRIKAKDIFMLLNSFKTSGGHIKSVKVRIVCLHIFVY